MLTALLMMGFAAAVATPIFVLGGAEDAEEDPPEEGQEELQALDTLVTEAGEDPGPDAPRPDPVAPLAVSPLLSPGDPDAVDMPGSAMDALPTLAPTDPDALEPAPDEAHDSGALTPLRPAAGDDPEDPAEDPVDHVHDFVPGLHLLRLTISASPEEVDVAVTPSSGGDAAVVTANGVPLAVLHGAPDATLADLDLRFRPGRG